jgi:hypothetical protein
MMSMVDASRLRDIRKNKPIFNVPTFSLKINYKTLADPSGGRELSHCLPSTVRGRCTLAKRLMIHPVLVRDENFYH